MQKNHASFREKKTIRRRPSWLDEGIVVAGSWEGLAHQLRLYGDHNNMRKKLFEEEHTRDTAEKLKNAGVNLLITHLYKGMGVKAERKEMEMTRDFTKICHEYDIKVGVYVQSLSSIYYESFFNELPEAVNWVSRDQNGNIPRYPRQYFRYIACPGSDEYLEYIETNILAYAVKEVKADMIHFDNFRWWSEPEACRCERCAEKFRQFIIERFPNVEERFSALGIEDVSYVKPPEFHFLLPPWKIDGFRDPLEKLWVDFKCFTLANIYRRFADFLLNLNPEIAIECNVGAWCGTNSSVNRGAWVPWIYPYGDFFWNECPDKVEFRDDGTMISRIRDFKVAQALDNILLSYNFNKIELAESLAFNNNCTGMTAWVSDILKNKHEGLKDYISFFKKNNHLFKKAEPAAEVAVFYSYESLNYLCGAPHLELLLAEQSLIQDHIPFDIIYDNQLERLGKYKVIVLADVEYLSGPIITKLLEYVNKGGGLVLTGKTSLFTEKGFLRETADFNGALDMKINDCFDKKTVLCRKNIFGKGRLVYLSGLKPAVIPEGEQVPTYWTRAKYYDKRWWKKPLNDKDFIEAVSWASQGFDFEFQASESLLVEIRFQRERQCYLLHFLNYKPGNNVYLKCFLNKRIMGDGKVKAEIFSPDGTPGEKTPVIQKEKEKIIEFSVSNMETYSILRLSPKTGQIE
ncbi:MAG: hypothetical protein PHV82_07690 [Victivallaceae bacterium]|nr:hypothetical protein [Victivallaceae bacterium]